METCSTNIAKCITKGEKNMKNVKILKVIISMIIFLGILFSCNLLYDNVVYAGNGKDALGSLDSYNGRECWRIRQIKS